MAAEHQGVVVDELVGASVVHPGAVRAQAALDMVGDDPVGLVNGVGTEIRRVARQCHPSLVGRRAGVGVWSAAILHDDHTHESGRVVHEEPDAVRRAERWRIRGRQRPIVGIEPFDPGHAPGTGKSLIDVADRRSGCRDGGRGGVPQRGLADRGRAGTAQHTEQANTAKQHAESPMQATHIHGVSRQPHTNTSR